MRPVWLCAAFLVACGGGGATTDPRVPAPSSGPGELADEDRYVPTYAMPELQRAIERERGAEASAERALAELDAKGADDQYRAAAADLDVRRRFIAALAACAADGRHCPPRLDDAAWAFDPDSTTPPMTASLRFDLASWRVLADELHGRACACRSLSCVDAVGVAIDQLEPRPMPHVQGDEVASLSITRARACLFRLRGKRR